ncbi:hypothetical protein [Sinorhizobium medicae]|nr:hypothetical protein [Sinorhizobium medicae]
MSGVTACAGPASKLPDNSQAQAIFESFLGDFCLFMFFYVALRFESVN